MKKLIQILFVEKTNVVFIQFFRYTFAGGTAFLVDFGLLFFLTDVCGLHYLVSATIALITGFIANYLICIFWIFQKSKYNRKQELLYFILIGLTGLALNNVLMFLFTDKIKFHYLVSKIVAAILVYLWNFFARRYLLFNAKNDIVKGGKKKTFPSKYYG